MIEPSTAIQICRFLHDSALLLLWGTAAFVAFLMPPSLAAQMLIRLGIFPLVAAGVAVLTTVAALPLQAAALGNGWPDAVDGATVYAVLVASPFALFFQAQAVAGLLLMLAFIRRADRRMGTVALASAVGLAGLALTGHASMEDGLLRIAHRLNDIVHLLAGGAWLGALIPFVVVLRMLAVPEYHTAAQVALRRFSNVGHGAVFLVLATGIVNSIMTLGRWPTDWSSPYLLMLTMKIAAVGMMTCLAIVNRYVFVPAIAENPDAALLSIRRASLVEILLGVAAIGLVAVFGTLDPT